MRVWHILDGRPRSSTSKEGGIRHQEDNVLALRNPGIANEASDLQQIWMADMRENANLAFDLFVQT
jgi:hypothetical protein